MIIHPYYCVTSTPSPRHPLPPAIVLQTPKLKHAYNMASFLGRSWYLVLRKPAYGIKISELPQTLPTFTLSWWTLIPSGIYVFVLVQQHMSQCYAVSKFFLFLQNLLSTPLLFTFSKDVTSQMKYKLLGKKSLNFWTIYQNCLFMHPLYLFPFSTRGRGRTKLF